MSPEAQAEGPRHVRVGPDVIFTWAQPTALFAKHALYIGVGDPHDADRRYWVVFTGATLGHAMWVKVPPGFRLGVRVESLAPGSTRISFVNWAEVPPSVHEILRDLTPTLQALIDVREGEAA